MLRDVLSSAQNPKPRLFFLGQAGFAMQNSRGRWLLVDPYLSDCVRTLEGHEGYKRLAAAPVTPAEMPADVIIATHHHKDHYDKDAMPALMKAQTVLLAARDCRELAAENGLEAGRVRYVSPGDRAEIAGFSLHFVSCDHGTGAPLAVGVLVEFDGFRLLFAGDTCLRPDYQEEYLSDGPLDLLAAPINGAYGNLDYKDCAALADLLKPRLLIPCHFGMFASHGGRADLFYDLMTKEYPEQAFLFMYPGEEYDL